MRTQKRFLFFVLVVLAIPASAQTALAAPYVIGHWFGQGQPDDKTSMYLDHMLPNGDFRGEYRYCVKGKAIDSVQSGRWTLSGDKLTLIIGNDGGMPVLRTDLYTMLSHDDRTWTYRYEPTGFLYNARRVDDRFKFPPCQLIS